MLEIKNLKKVYKMSKDVAVTALNGVNFHMQKGEFIAVMGSSGSGKSTLLHIIGGVDLPTSGSVVLDGKDIGRMGPGELAKFRRSRVGIIYQSYNLIPTLTVEENMALPLMLDKRPPKKEELGRMLELLGLADRRKHLPGQLSGGQMQRTAIGRVLLMKPALLLADEPTGNLDSRNSREVLELLMQANGEYGQTILLVTHDENVGKAAKRRILMKDGEIVSDH